MNDEACFTLEFKNKDDLRLSNVSFLDIYIITSEQNEHRTTSTLSPSSSKSSSSRASSSSASSSKSTSLRYPKAAQCDCTLEVLADGLYLVKYKLARRGVYSLNILVNKKHIGHSPYRLVCLERALNSRMAVKANSTLNVRSSTLMSNGNAKIRSV